ncbi:unnamed protein product [Tilletia controversa]|nr:unnamed protein product [Tilletia controversa]CAD6979805.1 unnamed protein product [Tilletia controversa]
MASDDETVAGSASPQPEGSTSQAPPPKKTKAQQNIDRAIAKFRGWPAREIVIHNEGYGAILRALKEEYGLEYNVGRFSEEEAQTVHKQVTIFMKRMRMKHEHLHRALYGQQGKRNKAALKELVLEATTALNGARPYPAVREFIQRQYREGGYQGRWSKEEEKQLCAAIKKHGNRWESIAEEVGRTGEDCRAKWRRLKERDDPIANPIKLGPWTDEETKKLVDTVDRLSQEMGIEMGLEFGQNLTGVEWQNVVNEAGLQRDPIQSRNKYITLMKKDAGVPLRPPKKGSTKRFGPEDRLILVDRIIAQLERSSLESEINWAKLSDKAWNWRPSELIRRWAYIKRRFSPKKPRGSFWSQLEAMRKKVLRNSNRFLRRKEQEKIQRRELRKLNKANASVPPTPRVASDSDAEGTPPSAQPHRPSNQSKSKGKDKAATTSSSSASRVLGKRRRDDSSSSGTSSDDSDSDSDSDPGSGSGVFGRNLIALSRLAPGSQTTAAAKKKKAVKGKSSNGKSNAKAAQARRGSNSGSGSQSNSDSDESGLSCNSAAGAGTGADSSSSDDSSSSSDSSDGDSSSDDDSSDSDSSSDDNSSDDENPSDQEQIDNRPRDAIPARPYDYIDSEEEELAMMSG